MTTDIERLRLTHRAAELWPPDDTKESIVGTDLHQKTIYILRGGINDIATASAPPGAPVPWYATDQLLFLGCRRPDDTEYRVYPDVFVFPHPIDEQQGSFSLSEDGPPVLVIEVLSESTADADLNMEEGKGYSYARAGLHEYLALDPTGNILPEQGRGWQLEAGRYQPWPRDEQGRWHSREIDVIIGFEGIRAAVYSRTGQRQLREGEGARVLDELARLRRTLEDLGHRADE